MGLARVALVALVVLGAATLGAWRVSGALASTPGSRSLAGGGMTVTVVDARSITGLSDHDLGGMAHGVQGLVTRGRALVQVSLVLRGGSRATHYDTTALEAVQAGSTTGVRPVGGTLARGTLAAHGRVEGTVSYVVPRNGAAFRLRLGHGGREIPLLRVGRAAPSSTEHPDHADDTHTH